ncbi:MAG: response regulator [Proteobacteria bacterium]|nr:response regulator [Pseudomonadota bacterium]
MLSFTAAIGAFYFLALGILVLWKSKDKNLSLVFFFLCITAFMWQLTFSLLYRTKNYETGLLAVKVGWSFILFLPTLFYHFLTILSGKKDEIKWINFSYVICCFFLIFLLFSNLLISGLYPTSWSLYPRAGVLEILHILQTMVVVIRGLYLVVKSNKDGGYKTKIQFQYYLAGIILLSAAVDYLCNYGLEIYPPGLFFVATSLTIFNYTVIKGRLLDVISLISHSLIRIIAYALFLAIFICYYFLTTGKYFPANLYYFFSGAILFILACETYSRLIERIQKFSDSKLIKKRRKNKDLIDLLNRDLEKSVSLEQLVENIKTFLQSDPNVSLVSFYVKKELSDDQKNIHGEYFDIMASEKFIDLSDDFISKIISLRSLVESDEYPSELLECDSSKVFIPFINSEELIGFALLAAKKSLKFYNYEIFDLLISRVGTLIDRIRAYREISLQKQKILEDKAKFLKSLAGSIVHEIRNPLNTINLIGIQIGRLISKGSNFDLSTQIETKEQLIDLTNDISETVADANNIIKVILSDLSEKQVSEEDFSYLRVGEVLPDIVDKYGYNNEEERSRVSLDISEDFTFKAVLERFQFVIFNLLKNALYYSKQYPNLTIKIGTEQNRRHRDGGDDRKYNVIYVKDNNSPGIAPEMLNKLFDDFYTVGKKGGTGLGLSFCKRNMNLFGGDIVCESEVGKWTKFSLLFPQIEISEEINEAENGLSALDLSNKTILIADDDQKTLINLKEYLISLNAEVITANDGKELLEAFIKKAQGVEDNNHNYNHNQNQNQNQNNDLDLIITDIDMPIMNGDEASRLVREYEKQQNLKPIPIIAVTGNEENLLSFYKSGINDCFLKGDDYKKMEKVIGLWVG